jgi:four helix bundle protein
MENSTSFKQLTVWQKAHHFVVETYAYTGNFPKSELYGLTSQFRRAAVSIAANIAEGFVKRSKRDKLRYFNIAQGSLEECRYYVLLSADLGYGTNTNLNSISEEVSKLLNRYIAVIETDIRRSDPIR